MVDFGSGGSDAVTERHGLFRLHPRASEPYDSYSFDADIVAIHGLGGHPFNTWTDKDGHLWLRDSLPKRVPRTRVLTYGYDSAVFMSRTRSSIGDFAADLNKRLDFARRLPHERTRPVVFVCHSLGGVVFKELLVQLSLKFDAGKDLRESITGVVFMGTPHRGSRAASPANLLSKIINVATLGGGVRTDLVHVLEVSSAELETISRHATDLLGSLSVVSFYERKPLGPTLIVEPFSAILGIPNERAIPLNADHRGIARVSPRKEQLYLPVWMSVREMVEASSVTVTGAIRDLLSQLYCTDYKTAQLRPRLPQRGTCNWIFNDPTYSSWMHSEQSSMLLLTGPAGSGKSVLTRHLTENILSESSDEADDPGYVGISFFCSYDEAAVNNEETVLRSLLHQLIQLSSDCAPIVRNRLERRNAFGITTSMLAKDLWDALTEVLSMSTMEWVFIAIDAIEELGQKLAVSILVGLWKIVRFLNRRHPGSRLRILVSSRHDAAYVRTLPHLTMLQIEKSVVQQDIKQYLSNVVDDFADENSAFEKSISADGTRQKIITRISGRADGMFLQAVLTWEEFRRGLLWNQRVVAEKLDRLNTFPLGMTALYDRIIDGIDESIKDDAFSVFSILAAAARPLSEAELGIILGIGSTSRPILKSTDIEPFPDLYSLMEQSFPDLVTVQNDSRVTFVHLSFKEYLQRPEGHQNLIFKGRRKIARTCFKYLRLTDMLHDADNGLSRRELREKYPFLSYARDYFLYHIRGLPYDDSLWLSFADTASALSIYNLESLQPETDSGRVNFPISPLTAVLEYVPAPGKFRLIREFKEHGYDLEEKWSRNRCGWPLQHCCSYAGLYKELNEAALLLLRLGTNPNLPVKPFRSNIRRAVESKAWDLYDTLLRHPQIDHNATDSHDRTTLHTLVLESTFDRIAEVLDTLHDVDVNIQDMDGYTPLHLACSLGRVDVVRKLLNVPGIRLDLTDRQGRTALTLATYWGQKQVALVLIEHSQAFPMPEEDQLSPLVFSAQHGQHDLCLRLLALSHYRDLNFHIDLSGRCILHHAAINNWDDVLWLCISKGVPNGLNLNQIDHSGKTALHHAAALGNVKSCDLLVDGGASLTLQDRNGRTATQAAADAGFKDVLMVLLKSGGVDPNQCDVEGRNLVHWLATLDCLDLMEMLVAMPVAVEWARRDKHGKRPVDIAGMCKCKYVGQFLAKLTPGWMYEWPFDLMYHSETVEGLDDEEFDRLEQRRVRRLIYDKSYTSLAEWNEIHERYPVTEYGLVPYGRPEGPNPPPPPNVAADRRRHRDGSRSRPRRHS